MALGSLNYTPSVTGTQIKNAIQSAGVNMGRKMSEAEAAASKLWSIIIGEIYNDFSSVLSTAILSYLNTAQSIFIPAPPNPYIVTNVALQSFKGKKNATAQKIISDIKASVQGSMTAQQQASNVWRIVLKNIFDDMKDVIGKQVTASCNQAFTLVGAGAIAAPHTGTITPVPATLMNPFVESQLRSFMEQYYNENQARIIAESMVPQIQSQKMQSEQIWDLLITKIKTGVNSNLGTHIKNFLTNGNHYIIPLGTPGLLIIIIVPTSGTVYGTLF